MHTKYLPLTWLQMKSLFHSCSIPKIQVSPVCLLHTPVCVSDGGSFSSFGSKMLVVLFSVYLNSIWTNKRCSDKQVLMGLGRKYLHFTDIWLSKLTGGILKPKLSLLETVKEGEEKRGNFFYLREFVLIRQLSTVFKKINFSTNYNFL